MSEPAFVLRLYNKYYIKRPPLLLRTYHIVVISILQLRNSMGLASVGCILYIRLILPFGVECRKPYFAVVGIRLSGLNLSRPSKTALGTSFAFETLDDQVRSSESTSAQEATDERVL